MACHSNGTILAFWFGEGVLTSTRHSPVGARQGRAGWALPHPLSNSQPLFLIPLLSQKSLPFHFRLLLEKSVQYLNKLTTFKDPHMVKVINKKGRSSTIMALRFLVEVGGRLAPIDCKGRDLAILSDNVFFLESDPGKTLCVGASYTGGPMSSTKERGSLPPTLPQRSQERQTTRI